MRRRTLDLVFSAGGVGVAALMLVLAIVLASNASFARTYVADQLGEQNITFKPAEALTPEEAESACLVEYAGQPMTTGKQAECYANDFIGLHLKSTAGGATYAELGTPERELREQVASAEQANDPSLPALQAQLAEISRSRDTVFKGETLRGLLLTTYGFSIFGDKAGQAADVLFVLAGLMGLLSIAGFAHAVGTPRDKKVNLEWLGNGHTAAPVAEEPTVAPKRRPVAAGTSNRPARPKTTKPRQQ